MYVAVSVTSKDTSDFTSRSHRVSMTSLKTRDVSMWFTAHVSKLDRRKHISDRFWSFFYTLGDSICNYHSTSIGYLVFKQRDIFFRSQYCFFLRFLKAFRLWLYSLRWLACKICQSTFHRAFLSSGKSILKNVAYRQTQMRCTGRSQLWQICLRLLVSLERLCEAIIYPHIWLKLNLLSKLRVLLNPLKRGAVLRFTFTILIIFATVKLENCSPIPAITKHSISLLVSHLARQNADGRFPVCQQVSLMLF
jgi:hypothetical protein